VDRLEAISRLQALAQKPVEWGGRERSWAAHTQRGGAADEEQLVQPVIFPALARQLLGFTVGIDLAAERGGASGVPDFTPADLLTHSFVFETKGSSEGIDLRGHEAQVRGYLTRAHIRAVVVTNVVGIRVFELDQAQRVVEVLTVNLRALWSSPPDQAVNFADAHRLVDFVERFQRRQLTTAEKISSVRRAPPWTNELMITDPSWLEARISRVVDMIHSDVSERIRGGALDEGGLATEDERKAILVELRQLLIRFGVSVTEAERRSLADFTTARPSDDEGKATTQYAAHVAYLLVTKLVLVRAWEDLSLISPASLFNGGFDQALSRYDEAVLEVLDGAFHAAGTHYRALFAERPAYAWYTPGETLAVDIIYELATTNFGAIESDILGHVYQGMLEGIDRKLLGQYYTPRDIIRLICDLAVPPDFLGRFRGASVPKVLDIATGSGGFLVEMAVRERARYQERVGAGAQISRTDWMRALAGALNGVEIQRFSAFLAELNLLIQFSRIVVEQPSLRIPELGIIPGDTLSLHDPITLFADDPSVHADDFLPDVADRRERAARIRDAHSRDMAFDLALGNPPYVGEKLGAALLQRTRQRYPYWSQFSAAHADYLYNFLILGISKLREGGRFGFITTEYWLRATGAHRLREYIAERCCIDRIILFRNMRLFPDAPGQHSMVIVGECNSNASERQSVQHRPRISIYGGGSVRGHDRQAILSALRDGRTSSSLGVASFRAPASPAALGGDSWAGVVLTRAALRRRVAARDVPQLGALTVTEGVIATPQALRARHEDLLRVDVARALGANSRAGIFLLTQEEVRALPDAHLRDGAREQRPSAEGPFALGKVEGLTAAERRVLRPVINTADVFPYAAVLAEDHRYLVYLRYEPSPGDLGLDLQTIQRRSFPDGLPNLARHMTRFRDILESVVAGYDRGNRRPWWSVHDDRAATVDQPIAPGQSWADYCVTARWGEGGRLVVGMAPAGSLPASGLHALRAPSGAPAAYVCAVLNCRRFQDLAVDLAPGHLRSEELIGLGIPLLDAEGIAAVSDRALQLANHVAAMVHDLGSKFPMLLDQWRRDVSLGFDPAMAWTPQAENREDWGTFASVPWITERHSHGPQHRVITTTAVSSSLFGKSIVASHEGTSASASLSLDLDVDCTDDQVAALCLYVQGLAARGVVLEDVLSCRLPLRPAELDAARVADFSALEANVARYSSLREEIDSLLGD